MKKCTNCNYQEIRDESMFCPMCGGQLVPVDVAMQQNDSSSQIQQQQEVIRQQQQMINTMMAQQQQMMDNNNRPANNITVPNFKIRNVMSLIAGIILIFPAFILNFYERSNDWGEHYEYKLKDFIEMIKLHNSHAIVSFFGRFALVALIVIIGVNLIDAFIDFEDTKKIVLIVATISVVCFVLLVLEETEGRVFSSLGFWSLFAGMIVSFMHDVEPKRVRQESPRFTLGTQGEWRCPKCDTKNTGSSCKVCGTSKN